ncbi:MAG: HEAT repeat domain-containing protein [Bdellovibrio sp.]|nr:HEAT repeat domain-containing protein [Bdellovibrio sp.]
MKYKLTIIVVLFLSLLTTNIFVARAQDSALEDTIRRSFDQTSTIDARSTALKELLEYAKKTPKVLDLASIQKIIAYSVVETEQSLQSVYFQLLNVSQSLIVLKHFAEAVTSTNYNLKYRFLCVSALGGFYYEPGLPNEEEYKKTDEVANTGIQTLLPHPNPNLRFMAVKTLGKRHYVAAAESLILMFATETVPQIKVAISEALIEMDAQDALKKESENPNSDPNVAEWVKKTFDELKRRLKAGMADIKSLRLISEFISLYIDDKEMEENIKYLKSVIEAKGPFVKPLIDIGEFAFTNLAKKADYDDLQTRICVSAYEILELLPAEGMDEEIQKLIPVRLLACRVQAAEKMFKKGQFYLSFGQRMRSKDSVKSAIQILSRMLITYPGVGLDVKGGILLVKARYLNKEYKSADDLITEIESKQAAELTKKQIKELNRLKKKIKRKL